MLQHLIVTYAVVTADELEENAAALRAAWDLSQPVVGLWARQTELQLFSIGHDEISWATVSLNHGGLRLEPKGPFETALFQSICTNEIDILLLQELGCNWSKMGRRGQWRERVNHALNSHCTRT